MFNSGLGAIGNLYRVYKAAQNLKDLYKYAELVAGLLSAIGQPTPDAAKSAIVSEIQKRVGAANIGQLLNGFDDAFKVIEPNWEKISRAIADRAPEISQEVAARVSPRIPKYAAIQAQGRLKPVIYAPTGPGSRGNEHYLDVLWDQGSYCSIAKW